MVVIFGYNFVSGNILNMCSFFPLHKAPQTGIKSVWLLKILFKAVDVEEIRMKPMNTKKWIPLNRGEKSV